MNWFGNGTQCKNKNKPYNDESISALNLEEEHKLKLQNSSSVNLTSTICLRCIISLIKVVFIVFVIVACT